MDTEYPVVPIRKHQTSIEDIEPGVPAPSIPRRHFELSAFERLSLEIRQIVYGLLGFPVSGKTWKEPWPLDLSAKARITHFEVLNWDSRFPNHGIDMHKEFSSLPDIWNPLSTFLNQPDETVLLFVNRRIRTELLQKLFQNTEIVFNFELSDKAIHFILPWITLKHHTYNAKERCRMHIPNEDFHWLTKVHLDRRAGKNFSSTFPHRLKLVSERTSLAKQARSIHYLADHCFSLRTFSVSPYLVKKDRGQKTPPKATQTLVLALENLAVKCEDLEAIVVRPFEWKTPVADLTYGPEYKKGPWVEQRIGLKDVPWYLRKDKVSEEAEAIFKGLSCAAGME